MKNSTDRKLRAARVGWIAVAAFSIASCGAQRIAEEFEPTSSYADYSMALVRLSLDGREAGKRWIDSGEQAVSEPLVVAPPLKETLYFDPIVPTAIGYSFEVKRGRRVEIAVERENRSAAVFFADLYRTGNDDGDKPEHVATLPPDLDTLSFEPVRDGRYIFRLQPELLAGGQCVVEIRLTTSLSFPVDGSNYESIGSFFGDSRDGGKRRHEGVDIFAPRGTDVLAPADGVVRRTGKRHLGGNTVMLSDPERSLTYYFAHLDTWAVKAGQNVKAGDVLGTVGNTGNAITTPPHLHFGIYSRGWGAIDPYYFIEDTRQISVPVQVKLSDSPEWRRTLIADAAVRSGPSPTAERTRLLERHTVFRIAGAAAEYYRVLLPDGVQGYVKADATEPIEPPIRSLAAGADTLLRHDPEDTSSAVSALKRGSEVAMLGLFGAHYLVLDPAHRRGWISKSAAG